MKNTIAVILAAGEGTRFKSETPKVLHKLMGKALIERVILKLPAGLAKTIVVVGHKGGIVRGHLESLSQPARSGKLCFATQEKQLGSGDAVKKAAKAAAGFSGNVLVLCGDTPLVKTETIKKLINFHKKEKADCTVLTFEPESPFGYGRIVRQGSSVTAIVEEKDADEEQKKLTEVNSGMYVFSAGQLFDALRRIRPDNAKKEYYLTDVIKILNGKNRKVAAFKIGDYREVIGINSRYELAAAETILRAEVLKGLMLSGVTVTDPATTYVDDTVKIGADVTILPSTMISGSTTVARGSTIGPFTFLSDSKVGRGAEIRASFVYGAEISDGVKVGPFSHIRPGTRIGKNSRVGNFSEVKKSTINENTKVSHLSYIGDACLGKNVNIGAGTITCNYDGKLKHHTHIDDDVFVGSNTNLVAPVSVGKGSLIAAGSTITDDVPAGSLAIARQRQIIKKLKKK
jgi:bifunctional UDP-N-acetylglucosamine pyrophosphorylase/glucosamine-1-phosphate N-acetyltransferase